MYNGKLISELTELVEGISVNCLEKMVDDVITENCLDGEGIPYYDVPDGAVLTSGQTEDDMEQARR